MDKARYGVHIHTVLSRIKYGDEVDAAIENTIYEGLITKEEKPVIE